MKEKDDIAWRYNRDHAPVIIPCHKIKEYESNGWVDSPAKIVYKAPQPEPYETIHKTYINEKIKGSPLLVLDRKHLLEIAKQRHVKIGLWWKRNDIIWAIIGSINGSNIKQERL